MFASNVMGSDIITISPLITFTFAGGTTVAGAGTLTCPTGTQVGDLIVACCVYTGATNGNFNGPTFDISTTYVGKCFTHIITTNGEQPYINNANYYAALCIARPSRSFTTINFGARSPISNIAPHGPGGGSLSVYADQIASGGSGANFVWTGATHLYWENWDIYMMYSFASNTAQNASTSVTTSPSVGYDYQAPFNYGSAFQIHVT